MISLYNCCVIRKTDKFSPLYNLAYRLCIVQEILVLKGGLVGFFFEDSSPFLLEHFLSILLFSCLFYTSAFFIYSLCGTLSDAFMKSISTAFKAPPFSPHDFCSFVRHFQKSVIYIQDKSELLFAELNKLLITLI